MEFLRDFGFNPVLLVAQIINFLIVLFILKKFMYRPVLDVIKKRENEIKKGLKNSEEAEKRLANAEEKEKQVLQMARITAAKMISDAKLEAEDIKEKKLTQTKLESEKMLEQARLTITQETKETEERLTKKVGGIAIALLEKSLKGIFGEKEQKIVLKKASAQIQKNR